MRVIAITMLRNEADVLPAFLAHTTALFDELLVVDHGSTDGSAEMLEAAARQRAVRLWRFPYRWQLQAEVMTALMEEAFAAGADWVVPLDADEFPVDRDPAALRARLPDAEAVIWRWRNLWPIAPQGFDRLDGSAGYEVLEAGRRDWKILVSRRRWERAPAPRLVRGSHAIAGESNDGLTRLGNLLHMPLRSALRAALKARGHHANNHDRPGNTPRQSTQGKRLAALAGEGSLADAAARLAPVLRAAALNYPLEPPERLEPLTRMEWAPCGPALDLPAPVADPEEVARREAELAWEAPPPRFRLALEPGRVRLVPA